MMLAPPMDKTSLLIIYKKGDQRLNLVNKNFAIILYIIVNIGIGLQFASHPKFPSFKNYFITPAKVVVDINLSI